MSRNNLCILLWHALNSMMLCPPSGLSWPGSSWMPFTFQLFTLTYHITAFSMHYELVPFFPKHFLKVLCGHNKAPKSHLKGLLPHQSDMPSLFIPVSTMGNCKQINNSNRMGVMSSNKLFLSLELPTLTRKLARMLKVQLG